MYKVVLTKQADRDLQKIIKSNLKQRLYKLMEVISEDPYAQPLEKLVGFENTFSKRINLQHRLVYKVIEDIKTIQILRMWTHYGDN